MIETQEFIVPTWRSRAKLLASIALFVAWGSSHQYWLAPLAERLRCANPCEHLFELRAGALYLTLLPLPLALWLSWFAHRIHVSGQFPPPGTWQLVRTRVHRGWRATAAVFVYTAFAITAAGSIGLIANWLKLAYIFCLAAPCGC